METGGAAAALVALLTLNLPGIVRYISDISYDGLSIFFPFLQYLNEQEERKGRVGVYFSPLKNWNVIYIPPLIFNEITRTI